MREHEAARPRIVPIGMGLVQHFHELRGRFRNSLFKARILSLFVRNWLRAVARCEGDEASRRNIS